MKPNSCTIAAAAMMPDGNGGWMPVPPTLTEDEAIRYLRLDTLSLKNPHKTLQRYRAEGYLESCSISNTNFYTPELLERFKQTMTNLTGERRQK
jgi:hypothetical protein